ncbi:hypothetical protein B6D52_00670 [Candidatus Parcubacteria bacterium 4484_255]|nr:MAG: hypothetical protein B6D52_00670 [Candidatus Parcubacteria bacterium 4484_255]
MRTLEHKNITPKKKIIFTILIFGLLFFVFNVNIARAGGAFGPCNEFCKGQCGLDSDQEYFDDVCRKVGVSACSCCKCEDKNNDVVCTCQCQNKDKSNRIENCYIGGLFRDERVAVCSCCGDCTLNDFLYIGVSIAELILKYLGVVALALFVLGGIIWITSGGSKGRVQKGVAIIKGAIIGIIIVIVAYSLVKVIMKDVLKMKSDYLPKSSVIEHKISE